MAPGLPASCLFSSSAGLFLVCLALVPVCSLRTRSGAVPTPTHPVALGGQDKSSYRAVLSLTACSLASLDRALRLSPTILLLCVTNCVFLLICLPPPRLLYACSLLFLVHEVWSMLTHPRWQRAVAIGLAV